MCSSITYRWKYDVFLSFHGEDTRLGFVSFLRESLGQRGIHVFIDDEFIRTGEEITPALLKAIQESRIAIIVFSKNYATSTFCLQELEKILECFKEEGRLIYPIFYHVDPSELRRPRGRYAKALAGLEKRFNDNKQRVEKWRLALFQAADLKGWHLKSKIANEQAYTTEIINEVSARINHNHNPLLDTCYPVGLVSRVKEVISLLDLWSTKENKMVGIMGPGGIGKSTIARSVYDSIAGHFDGLCFLSDIREKSKNHGLVHLQEMLLYKTVMERDLKLGDVFEGKYIVKRRLGHKKILLILDDIDELEQLEALAGSCNWFGPGSRIVITTRNKQLLVSHDVNNIYNVRELDDDESLQLLNWHAFKTDNVEFDFMEVSKLAVLYSCGFPLALEMIGSHLRGKGVNEWHSALDQFKRIPEGKVYGVLRLSYDALREIEKKIFLDLACFFKGEELGKVKDMLSCLHGNRLEYAIGVLVDKSLIKIEGNRILMHDLIEDMGKEIVRQESPNEPGERSRLWFYKDILNVLEQSTGTNKVEVISLDLPEHLLEGNGAQIQWSEKAFKKMKNLKMLVIKNASFSRRPAYLPISLRCLKWKGYPFQFLPYKSCLTELIYLDLSCSHFHTLHPFTKRFHNLSRMNFRNCKFLKKISDLSGVSNLRELWLDGCTDLVEIHHSVGCLNKLKELSAMRCYNLEILPPHLSLTSLEQLNLFGCSSLYCFPDILVEMKCLRTLDLGRTAIIALPSSICNLVGLETLNMEECPYLEQLPTTICLLPFLWALNASFSKEMTHFKMCEGGEENLNCYALSSKLEHFCFSKCNLSDDSLALCLSYFTNTIRLDMSFNNFTTLPACIIECHHLRYLLLDNCKQLQHIEEMPQNLEKFSAVCCISLTQSSENKILNQALNLQPGKRNFILPGRKFPENLHNYSTGSYVSFWIRDAFPTIFLWILVKHDQDFLSNCTFLVHVNDTKLDITSEWLLLSTMKMGHLYIWDLQSMIHKAELLPLGHRWNHVKVSIKSNTSGRDQFHFALHVYKQQNNPKTIQFMDPRTIYADSNLWQRVQQLQDLKELEDDMLYQDLAPSMVNPKAQLLPKEEDLKAKRAVLPSSWTYDVFLSYRGDYECSSFVSRLYNSLCQRGIHAFVNDELVKTSSGEELKAIRESRTAIIVISKNYKSSPSCLDSLVTILDCFRMECRFVCPIFYDLEPLELKHQTEIYGKVFDRLEKIFKHNKVQKWRLALSDAVNISCGIFHIGLRLVIKNATEDQDVIGSIICEVSSRINTFPLIVQGGLVRLESRVEEVISHVDVGSNEEVKIVGICGINISTMARDICSSIARHFEDLWYFDGAWEIARGYDSIWDDFQNLIIQPWFPQRKILVILDGVMELDQLRAVRECDRFGEGSRIIVATRNKQLLVSHGIKIIDGHEWNSSLDEKEKDPNELLSREEDLKAKRVVLPSRWTYDVFLSYGGDYECSSFVSCLYNSLSKSRIRAFVNDELVKTSGEQLKAIQESRTAIIVITRNYASSPSCLNGLATILECFRMECRIICPIFLDRPPFELQHSTMNYEEVLFGRIERRFKHNKEQVQKWRLALSEAVDISRGDDSSIYWGQMDGGYDNDFIIERAIEEVSARIGKFPLPVWDHSVELESHLQKVISLMDVGSSEEAKMVGICGKTRGSIAHALCNSIAPHFEDLWYFYGVREIARGYDSTWNDFQKLIIKPAFSQRKILLILDGVRSLDQLQAVRECDQFGEGSRIIVVISDKQL